MSIRLAIYIFLLQHPAVLSAAAQLPERLNVQEFNVNQGLLQTSIRDAAFDRNNFLWISFPNGIQKFDGKKFSRVNMQGGLPDDKWVTFFTCADGTLLLSHANGISRYDEGSDRLQHLYNSPGSGRASEIFGEKNKRIFFRKLSGQIGMIDLNVDPVQVSVGRVHPELAESPEKAMSFCENIGGDSLVVLIDNRLYLYNVTADKRIATSSPLEIYNRFFLQMTKKRTVLIHGVHEGSPAVMEYDFKTRALTKILAIMPPYTEGARLNILHTRTNTFLSVGNHLFRAATGEVNLATEMRSVYDGPAGGPAAISKLRPDRFGNLYLITISDGIKKIHARAHPLRYYGTGKDRENYILSIYPDKKNNRILVGTSGNGLLIFDTLQRLIKNIRTLPGYSKPFSCNMITAGKSGGYLFIPLGSRHAQELSADLLTCRPVLITRIGNAGSIGSGYYAKALLDDAGLYVAASGGNVYTYNRLNGVLSENGFISSGALTAVLFNDTILIHNANNLIFYDKKLAAPVKTVALENTGGVRCFLRALDNTIWAGTNNGIFHLSQHGILLKRYSTRDGLPDDCIYAMIRDKRGDLWCSTNKGIFRFDENGRILRFTKSDGLQENEFNTEVQSVAADGELFFGGVNGFNSFFPPANSPGGDTGIVLLSNIRVNNHDIPAPWSVTDMRLAHDENLLEFDFLFMSGANPEQCVYQYRMKGFDKEWLKTEDHQTIRYLLPPGNYELELCASPYFNNEALAMKTVRIRINPPFWQSWWFLGGLSLFLLMLVVLAVNRYNRKKFRRRLYAFEGDKKLRIERERIARDLHDNIGVYANAVLHKTELLEERSGNKPDELVRDLRFASKDIIISLRETVWALKQEEYSAEECLLRIRNFVQSFDRYYGRIKFTIAGEAPAQKLHYTDALNLVRIVQEAITNAIKHADPELISVLSNFSETEWRIRITNNGKPFSEAGEDGSGTGIETMHTRAGESGFGLQIAKGESDTTSVTITIPLSKS